MSGAPGDTGCRRLVGDCGSGQQACRKPAWASDLWCRLLLTGPAVVSWCWMPAPLAATRDPLHPHPICITLKDAMPVCATVAPALWLRIEVGRWPVPSPAGYQRIVGTSPVPPLSFSDEGARWALGLQHGPGTFVAYWPAERDLTRPPRDQRCLNHGLPRSPSTPLSHNRDQCRKFNSLVGVASRRRAGSARRCPQASEIIRDDPRSCRRDSRGRSAA